MNEFLRNLGDCISESLALGQSLCSNIKFGDLEGIGLVRKGYVFSKEDLTREGFQKLIDNQTVSNILDVYGFAQNTAENEVATSERGDKSRIRFAKPDYSVTLTKGNCFHKLLMSKINTEWDFLLYFDGGLFIAESDDALGAVGFDSRFTDLDTFKFQQGTDPEQSVFKFQLSDAIQFNEKGYFLPWSTLGFNVKRMPQPLQVVLNGTGTATEIKVKVSMYCNSSETVLGLEDANNWTVDGVKPTTVDYDTAEDLYTLTGTYKLASTVLVKVEGKVTEGRSLNIGSAKIKIASA